MFGRKKQQPSSSGKGKALMQQMGWTNVDDMEAAIMSGGLGEDDEDLEAELLALQDEGSPATSAKTSPVKQRNEGMQAVHALDRMVAQCMADIPDDVNEEDINDPDLLAELQELESPVRRAPSPQPPAASQPVGVGVGAVVEERLGNYTAALANAKAASDSSKVRRAERGIKTLKDLQKKVKAGRQVDEGDIPPPMALTVTKSAAQSPTSPVQPPPSQPSPPMVFEPTISEPPVAKTNSAPAPKPAAPQPAPKPAAPAPAPRAPAPAPAPREPAPTPAPRPVNQNTAPQVAPVKASPSPPKPKPSEPKKIEVPPSLSAEDGQTYKMLAIRKEQYLSAALQAKRHGNKPQAAKYLHTMKQFDAVLGALVGGKAIDLSQMPPPPPGYTAPAIRESSERQGAGSPRQQPQQPQQEEMDLPEVTAESKKKLFDAPESAGSTLEALNQRLEKYKSAQTQAEQEGNGSKAKRHGRIVKQYQAAIKQFRAGKPIDFEELPTPPGFPPIPLPSAAPKPAASPAAGARQPAPGQPAPRQPAPQPAPRQPAPKPAQPAQGGSGPPPAKKPTPGLQRQMSTLSRQEQQTVYLEERQLQFKKAAIKAKQNGDIELAKKYLKSAMGMDQMIVASQSGLPVNLSQLPPPPGVKDADSFEFVPGPDDSNRPVGDRDEEYKKLEQDLIQQIRMCSNNSEHFTKLGDVSSASKFDKMALNARRDLDAIKNAYKHGDPVPRFHYETRTFSMVQSCSDLGDNDLELVIIRGTNYPLPSGYQPKDLDTYVKFEFPFPNEDPQKGDTHTCKDTDNPEYNQSFKLHMNRKSRAFHRILKSKSLKLEVFYKRGFLKGDKILGTINIKLQPLENTCILHESYDLLDGRKSVGGKLEVKMRVRDPFFTKQVEEVKERWLVIDHFDRAEPPVKARKAPVPKALAKNNNPAPAASTASMEVLKYERSQLEAQIRRYEGRLTGGEADALSRKVALLSQEIDGTRARIKQGGLPALRAYADAIEGLSGQYLAEGKALLAAGNRDKAAIIIQKKKLVEKEVEGIRSKLPPS